MLNLHKHIINSKRILLSIFLLLFCGILSVQSQVNLKNLANKITTNCKTEKDKVLAIHTWVTGNIDYDLSLINKRENYESVDEIIAEALKTKKGVCQHYAELFKALCSEVNIPCWVILGFSNQNNVSPKLGHAWNVVLLNKEYLCVDATWDAGYIDKDLKYTKKYNENYLLVEPSEFIKTHMPYDPLWQLLESPISCRNFQDNNFSSSQTNKLAFRKIIDEEKNLSLLDKTIRQKDRIQASNCNVKLVNEHVMYLEVIIANEKFKISTDLFNQAIQDFNAYIRLKNSQFKKTTVDDKVIENLISNSSNKLSNSIRTIENLSSTEVELNNELKSLKEVQQRFDIKLQEELRFCKKYFTTAKSKRLSLFYVKK